MATVGIKGLKSRKASIHRTRRIRGTMTDKWANSTCDGLYAIGTELRLRVHYQTVTWRQRKQPHNSTTAHARRWRRVSGSVSTRRRLQPLTANCGDTMRQTSALTDRLYTHTGPVAVKRIRSTQMTARQITMALFAARRNLQLHAVRLSMMRLSRRRF